ANAIAVIFPRTPDASAEALYVFAHEIVARLVDEAIRANTTQARQRSAPRRRSDPRQHDAGGTTLRRIGRVCRKRRRSRWRVAPPACRACVGSRLHALLSPNARCSRSGGRPERTIRYCVPDSGTGSDCAWEIDRIGAWRNLKMRNCANGADARTSLSARERRCRLWSAAAARG